MIDHIIYCNICYKSTLITNNATPYFITNCGKVICHNCITLQTSCNKCGTNCSRKMISQDMNFDTLIFFNDTGDLEKKIQIAESFQFYRLKQLCKYLYQKTFSLKQFVEERCHQIQMLEERKCSVEFSLNKLRERQRQQRFHHADNNYNNSFSNMHYKDEPFLSKVIDQMENSFTSNNTSGVYVQTNIGNLNQTPSQIGSRTSGKGSIIGKAFPLLRDTGQVVNNKQHPKFESNFASRVYNSTPIVGHETNATDFGFRNAPPSSIISAATLRYFRHKREQATNRFFK